MKRSTNAPGDSRLTSGCPQQLLTQIERQQPPKTMSRSLSSFYESPPPPLPPPIKSTDLNAKMRNSMSLKIELGTFFARAVARQC